MTATLNGQIHATGTTTTRAVPGVGQALRTLREAHGVSQARLSLRSGMSEATVSRLESGERQPSRRTILAIALALRLTVPERVHLMGTAGYLDSAVPVSVLVAWVARQEATA